MRMSVSRDIRVKIGAHTTVLAGLQTPICTSCGAAEISTDDGSHVGEACALCVLTSDVQIGPRELNAARRVLNLDYYAATYAGALDLRSWYIDQLTANLRGWPYRANLVHTRSMRAKVSS